jgi:hypothetical protein
MGKLLTFLLSFSFQTLGDKEMRVLLQWNSTRGVVRLLWRSWWWVWFNFQKIIESLEEIW